MDAIGRLQEQIDHLTSRLDLIAPKLSLLNLMSQNAQKSDCEVSLQVAKLKSSKEVLKVEKIQGDGDFSTSGEMAIWMRIITNLVLNLLECRSHDYPSTTEAEIASLRNTFSDPFLDPFLQPVLSSRRPLAKLNEPCNRTGSKVGEESPLQPAASLTSMQSKCTNEVSGNPAPRMGEVTFGSAAPAMPAAGNSTNHAWYFDEAEMTMATSLDAHGIVLGKGAWANEYRQARGIRRDALRMLSLTRIITERELADDLTDISREHIEECISIATEMLEKWPAPNSPPIAEAKAFFEDRLAQMFMSKGRIAHFPE